MSQIGSQSGQCPIPGTATHLTEPRAMRTSLLVLLLCAACAGAPSALDSDGGSPAPAGDGGAGDASAPSDGGQATGPRCGDGELAPGEVCDGAQLDGTSCQSLGYEGGGKLSCAKDCKSFDAAGCVTSARCGDGAIGGPEVCDGSKLDGASCQLLGFEKGGTLTCAHDCRGFDTAGCATAARCGDGAISGPEVCDGAQLNGASCAVLGFAGGTLACRADCGGYDLSGCRACAPTATDPCLPADEVLFNKAMAAFQAKDWAGARELFDLLWAAFPSSSYRAQAGTLRGRCRFELGDYQGALEALGQMRALYPFSPYLDAAIYYSGRCQFRLLDYPAAMAEFKAAAALSPTGPYADKSLYYLGVSQFELKQYGDSLATLTKLLADFPASTLRDDALYYRGRGHFELALADRLAGKPADAKLELTPALADFDQVLADPVSTFQPNAGYYQARVHFEQGEIAQAAGDAATAKTELTAAHAGFAKFLAGYPTHKLADNAAYYLALCDFRLADYAAAVTDFTSFLNGFPTSNLRDAGLYFRGRSDFQLAEAAKAADPVTATAEYQSALTDLAAALAIPSTTVGPAATYFQGRCHFGLAELNAAANPTASQADFTTARGLFLAVTTGPFADNAAYYLGVTDYKLTNYAVAVAELTSFITSYPTSSFLAAGYHHRGLSHFHLALAANAIADTATAHSEAALADADFVQVETLGSATYLAAACYYAGRSDYLAAGIDKLPATYADAVTRFESLLAKAPTSTWADKGLRYEVQVYVDTANCPSAIAARDRLTAGFPTSPEVAKAQSYGLGKCW